MTDRHREFIRDPPHVDDPDLHPVHHEPLIRAEAGLLRQLCQRLPHHKHLGALLPAESNLFVLFLIEWEL